MKLLTSPNMAIGFAEILFMQESLEKRLLIDQFVKSYGVVRKSEDFNELKIIQGAGNSITVNKGTAIDKDLSVISLPQLTDTIEIPNDSITRYIIVSYNTTTIEEGKVQIQTDGTVTIENTALPYTPFSKRMRGTGAFPTKISFPGSVNNVSEYFVRSVLSDTTLLLNVGQGVLIPENGLSYRVVGSFTPGAVIPDNEKNPFVRDSYMIESRTSNSIIEGKEFILGSVQYDGADMTITDLRSSNQFQINSYI